MQATDEQPGALPTMPGIVLFVLIQVKLICPSSLTLFVMGKTHAKMVPGAHRNNRRFCIGINGLELGFGGS